MRPDKHMRRLPKVAAVGIMIGAVVVVAIFNPLQVTLPVTGLPFRTSPEMMLSTTGACQPNHPVFFYGFADLHARLGERMGEPIECEQSIHANGDTRQKTTTGYAYYRKADNVPTFTNGWDHWALTTGGLMYWSGDVVDPPTSADFNEAN